MLKGLNHHNIVNILGYGTKGKANLGPNKEHLNLTYIIMEYVEGHQLLFNLVEQFEGLGEDVGRFFMH